MKTLIAAAAALCASTAFAQDVSVTVQGAATAEPGEVVTVSVYADVTGLPGTGAVAGYGLDLTITAGDTAVSNVTTASSPVLFLGTVPGTVSATGLTYVVGGQLSNIFALNPAVDQSLPILLFTTGITVDAGATDGTLITLEASSNGGVILYPDVASGANITAPDEPGTTLGFTGLTITVQTPGTGCAGDVNGDGSTDVFDFADLAANFGAGPGATKAMGDLDANGFVNVFDFGILAADFGCQP